MRKSGHEQCKMGDEWTSEHPGCPSAKFGMCGGRVMYTKPCAKYDVITLPVLNPDGDGSEDKYKDLTIRTNGTDRPYGPKSGNAVPLDASFLDFEDKNEPLPAGWAYCDKAKKQRLRVLGEGDDTDATSDAHAPETALLVAADRIDQYFIVDSEDTTTSTVSPILV